MFDQSRFAELVSRVQAMEEDATAVQAVMRQIVGDLAFIKALQASQGAMLSNQGTTVNILKQDVRELRGSVSVLKAELTAEHQKAELAPEPKAKMPNKKAELKAELKAEMIGHFEAMTATIAQHFERLEEKIDPLRSTGRMR
jgi:peptidoglycan hydrolase CwlO-like protein